MVPLYGSLTFFMWEWSHGSLVWFPYILHVGMIAWFPCMVPLHSSCGNDRMVPLYCSLTFFMWEWSHGSLVWFPYILHVGMIAWFPCILHVAETKDRSWLNKILNNELLISRQRDYNVVPVCVQLFIFNIYLFKLYYIKKKKNRLRIIFSSKIIEQNQGEGTRGFRAKIILSFEGEKNE